MSSLKPQDIVVLLKLCGYDSRPPYSVIAANLRMSQSEINASIKRLQTANLVLTKELGEMPILDAVEEFLIHGVKYAFPAKRGFLARGMPTSYSAEPLKSLFVSGDEPVIVWPDAKGRRRGVSILPLYKSVPEAARLDSVLYSRLALLDAIRSGGAREREIATRELKKSLRQINGKHEP